MARGPDHTSLELENAALSGVARQSPVFGTFLKSLGLVSALAIGGWLIYASAHKPSRLMTAADTDEFRTTQFPAPQYEAPRPQLDTGRFVVPPPPPPPVAELLPPPPMAPPSILPPPPLPEPAFSPQTGALDDGGAEARRLAEIERLRLAELERRKWERLRAPQMIADASGNSGAPGAAAGGNSANGGNGGPVEREEDSNRRFLASAGNAGVEKSVATKNPRIDALIAQGTTIRGVLETALQSDLPGMVRALTSEDVWSFDGRRILIPSGSRLVGEYKSGLSQGQTRVFVVWTRLLRADGVSVQLGSIGTDDLGRTGNSGIIDNHYIQRFGSAVALSILGGLSQYISGLGQQQQAGNGQTITTTDPVTGQTTTTSIQPNQNQQNARQIASQQVSSTLTNLANEALKSSINIPPTIYLDQGTRIIVFVKRDLDFAAFYPDPLKEALRELRSERLHAK